MTIAYGPDGFHWERTQNRKVPDTSEQAPRTALGPVAARPYLDLAVLERALVATEADAAWVGWGFVAEDPAFAELCEKLGITFVGPSAEAMRRLGDKIGAKLIAEDVGVPVAPWSRGAIETLDAAVAAAAGIGYPLMLKAAAGGSGTQKTWTSRQTSNGPRCWSASGASKRDLLLPVAFLASA